MRSATATHVIRKIALVNRLGPHLTRHFSQYENYSKTSKTYDNVRRPIALDVVREGFQRAAKAQGKKVSDLQVLDAGCGTGNYIHALAGDVQAMVGLDFNEGMLQQAQGKLGEGCDAVLLQGSIMDMPFLDNTFDAVVMNQVLHHIESPETIPTWQNVTQTLSEVRRVLKPGGAFIVSTQTPQQHVDGFWWTPIVPDASKTLASRFPELDWMKDKFTELGFETVQTHIPADPLIRADCYLDQHGPFDPTYRNGDSTWSLASESELETGLDWWQSLVNQGRAKEFLKEREDIRAQIGQTTSIVAC